MNDQEHNLIQAARNGDQAAFGELVQQYQKRVFALAVRMCPTPELAEEAACSSRSCGTGSACFSAPRAGRSGIRRIRPARFLLLSLRRADL